MAGRPAARAAAAAGRAGGLAIGLYRDLAVGVNPNGAEAWADQELVVPGAAIGAPPDPLSRAGQNWGLAPLNPLALRRRGFAPLIAALRANMRHAGVLRIDHVMGLQPALLDPERQPGRPPGPMSNYPFARSAAPRRAGKPAARLRRHRRGSRHRAGRVPRDDAGGRTCCPTGFWCSSGTATAASSRPDEYPPLAAASAATHDLATLKGFWLGRDIAWRRRLGLYPDAAAEATEADERAPRPADCCSKRWRARGCSRPSGSASFCRPDGEPAYGDELGEAILAYLARSRARLMLVQIEDVAGEAEQANLPGTTDGHPNWRRRLSVPLEELLAGPALARVAALVAAARRVGAEAAR